MPANSIGTIQLTVQLPEDPSACSASLVIENEARVTLTTQTPTGVGFLEIKDPLLATPPLEDIVSLETDTDENDITDNITNRNEADFTLV